MEGLESAPLAKIVTVKTVKISNLYSSKICYGPIKYGSDKLEYGPTYLY
jgi:hypothetical protein